MRRLTLIAVPFLAAFALVFGLYHLYVAWGAIQAGSMVRGLLLAVFGVVGIALAAGIWIARKRTLAPPPPEA